MIRAEQSLARPSLRGGKGRVRNANRKERSRGRFSASWSRHGQDKKPQKTVLGNIGRLAVGGSWRLAVAGWWRLAADRDWQLVVGGGWRLAVGGGWRLAVGGPWELFLMTREEKMGFFRTALRPRSAKNTVEERQICGLFHFRLNLPAAPSCPSSAWTSHPPSCPTPSTRVRNRCPALKTGKGSPVARRHHRYFAGGASGGCLPALVAPQSAATVRHAPRLSFLARRTRHEECDRHLRAAPAQEPAGARLSKWLKRLRQLRGAGEQMPGSGGTGADIGVCLVLGRAAIVRDQMTASKHNERARLKMNRSTRC